MFFAIKYLGSIIEKNNHIKLRKSTFYSTTKLEHMGLNYDDIEPAKKYIRLTQTYGIDNFELKATQIRKLQSINGSMLTNFLNLSKYFYNTELFTYQRVS